MARFASKLPKIGRPLLDISYGEIRRISCFSWRWVKINVSCSQLGKNESFRVSPENDAMLRVLKLKTRFVEIFIVGEIYFKGKFSLALYVNSGL